MKIELNRMVELTDAELDAVAAGQNPNIQVGNLVAANVVVDALNHNTVTLRNILNDNTVQVPVGVAVALLNSAAGVQNRLP